MGWKVYGERLCRAAAEYAESSVDFVPFTPWPWARHIYWQTGYSDNTPAHLNFFDPFTVMSWQAASMPLLWRDYSAAVVATQGVAAGIMKCRPKLPIFLIVDATRQLYKQQFGACHISDQAIEREATLFKKCAHIFSLSHWAAESIVGSSGIPTSKITVLPPPSADLAFKFEVKASSHHQANRLKVLFVGLDFKRKGGAKLLQWQRERLSQYIDLFIVTEDKHADPSVPNTTWLGPIKNDLLVRDIMSSMDILLHPTQKDCSSIVVAEAAMCGLPAIASSIGGIGDLIDNGITGVVIAPHQSEEFINTLIFYFHNRMALGQLGRNARDKALREFRANAILNKIMAIVKMSKH